MAQRLNKSRYDQSLLQHHIKQRGIYNKSDDHLNIQCCDLVKHVCHYFFDNCFDITHLIICNN